MDGPSTKDPPLRAHTLNELRYYLMVRPCPACGKGPRELDLTKPPAAPGQVLTVRVRCNNCKRDEDVHFSYDHELPTHGAGAEIINPTEEPSRIVDLAHWLSLFYLQVESAWREDSRPEVRRAGFQAALCLAEALRFYGDDELPPASAFFTRETTAAFEEHPEKFAKQKLRDMQSKLPALPTMAQRIDRDERTRRGRWWQFWKKK